MLYAIVFVVIIIIIILVFVVKKTQYEYRKRQAARESLPTSTSNTEGVVDPTNMTEANFNRSRDPGSPVTFGGVARSVTHSVFPQQPSREYDDEYQPFNRQSMMSERSGRTYTGRAVERAAESDPELPSYGDTRGTLPIRPEPIYDPTAARPRHDGTGNDFTTVPLDAPPKYAQQTVDRRITEAV